MRRNLAQVPLHEVDPEIFWSCVEVGGERDCWPWAAGKTDGGYGTLYVLGKTQYAHRIAWSLQHGRTPKPGVVVRHGCDYPPCCNPAHLYVGTIGDNNRDIARRARNKRYDPLAIARALAKGATIDDLTEIFGMHPLTAKQYVTEGAEKTLVRGFGRPSVDRRRSPKFDGILQAARDGSTAADLMNSFGVSRATAYRYLERARG